MNGDIRMSVRGLEAWVLKETGHGDVSYGTRGHNTQDMKMWLPRTQTSLSLDEDVRAKEGGKETSPAVCTLPMVPCGSSPVTRLYLAKNEAPEEEAGDVKYGTQDLICRTWRCEIWDTEF